MWSQWQSNAGGDGGGGGSGGGGGGGGGAGAGGGGAGSGVGGGGDGKIDVATLAARVTAMKKKTGERQWPEPFEEAGANYVYVCATRCGERERRYGMRLNLGRRSWGRGEGGGEKDGSYCIHAQN